MCRSETNINIVMDVGECLPRDRQNPPVSAPRYSVIIFSHFISVIL